MSSVLGLPASLCWLLPLGWLWFHLINHLRVEWTVNPQYAYGWAVPFLCAYLLSRRMQTTDVRCQMSGVRPPPSDFRSRSSGVWLLAVIALLYFPTRLIEEANPDWRLVSWALALEVVGLTLLALSQMAEVRSQRSASIFRSPSSVLRQLAFPICFFLIAVPWPTLIEGPLIQSLTRANAGTTVELLGIGGIPAVQKGNVIQIATGTVGVDEACSGIRSFQAALMIALFLGERYRLPVLRRLGLCLAGFGLSFVFNVGRTMLLVGVAAREGVPAIARWHDPAGITILVACFVCLWLLGVALKPKKVETLNTEKLKGEGGGEKRENGDLEGGDVPPLAAAGPVPSFQSAAAPANSRSAVSGFRSPSSVLRLPAFVPAALLAWFVLTESSVEWWYRSHEARMARSVIWTVNLPRENATFRELPMTEAARRLLRYDEAQNASWAMAGREFQVVFLRWKPGRIALYLARGHTPETCLTAAGRKLVSVSELKWFDVRGLHLPFRSYVVADAGQPLHVFYCLWDDLAGEQSFAATSLDLGNRLGPVLAGRRNPGQRSLEIAVWGIADADAAEAAVRQQLEKLIRVGQGVEERR